MPDIQRIVTGGMDVPVDQGELLDLVRRMGVDIDAAIPAGAELVGMVAVVTFLVQPG